MDEFLIDNRHIVVAFHILGVTLGLGGAIVTDLMFMRFLKDYRVSAEEKEVLDGLSLVIWGGVALLLLSGLALFWPYKMVLLQTPGFQAKMIVVAVILLNALFLNFYISPKLTSIVFNEPGANSPAANRIRKFAPLFGGISIISWIYTFFLGSMNKYLDYPLSFFLGVYVAMLALGVIVTFTVTRLKFKPKINQ